MLRSLTVVSLLLVITEGVVAQPRVDAAVNAASYASAELPHGESAPGALLVVFGEGLGPREIIQSPGFPLPFELGGTAFEVAIDGTTTRAALIYASDKQAAVVLSSRTPPGAGTLTAVVDGERSEPLPIVVAPRRFGLFSRDSSGQGEGVFTHEQSGGEPLVNSLIAAANPGEVWTLWGTGLGAAIGDDELGPLPGALAGDAPPVQVVVGTQIAETVYQGRSGCCAGLDQISFVIPAGVRGCTVPVNILADGALSNSVTMSITDSGRTCREDQGLFSSDILNRAELSTRFRLGEFMLSRSTRHEPEGAVSVGHFAHVKFGAHGLNDLLYALSFSPSVFGACYSRQFRFTRELFDRARENVVWLHAGDALQLVGPDGPAEMPRLDHEQYQLFSMTEEIRLPDGEYVVRGEGGPDVGAFMASGRLDPAVVWTNRESIGTVVDRSEPLEVRWQGGETGDLVIISGRSFSTLTLDLHVGAEFDCIAPAQAGSFAVPIEVLQTLPPTDGRSEGDGARGTLTVATRRYGGNFNAESGLDLGFVSSWNGEQQAGISYR